MKTTILTRLTDGQTDRQSIRLKTDRLDSYEAMNKQVDKQTDSHLD